MLTEQEINELGEVLEHSGLNDDQIDTYLAHHGVKGMKWGQRRNRRVQNQLDSLHRVSTGTGSARDHKIASRVTGARFNSSKRQKRAGVALKKGDESKKKIEVGKSKIRDLLLKAQGVTMKELNFHQE